MKNLRITKHGEVKFTDSGGIHRCIDIGCCGLRVFVGDHTWLSVTDKQYELIKHWLDCVRLGCWWDYEEIYEDGIIHFQAGHRWDSDNVFIAGDEVIWPFKEMRLSAKKRLKVWNVDLFKPRNVPKHILEKIND